MKYKNLLDKIYSNYKKNDIYGTNNFIKFYKENNTNIVKFEINDKTNKIPGIIIEQGHLIFIYYKINDSIFTSKAHIIFGKRAIIYNCVLNNGNIECQETIGRDFDSRENIYKFTSSDVVINDNLFDDEFNGIICDIEKSYYEKNKQKRLKI